MNASPSTLESRLARHVQRLGQRLARLRALDGQFSLYRLAAFILMLVLVWYAASALSGALSWAVGLGALLPFTGLVVGHRLLDRRTTRLRLWHARRADQLARLQIDWQKLPKWQPLPPWQALPALQALPSWQALPGSPERSPLALDLDLTGSRSLHHLLDTCTSQQGRQLLADWLTQSIPNPAETAARQAVVRELAGMPRFRDHLQLNFRLAADDLLQSQHLLNWLSVSYPASRLGWLAFGLGLLAALNLLLFILHSLGQMPAYWSYTLALYALITLFSLGPTQDFLNALLALDRELDKFSALLRYLERFPYGPHPTWRRSASLSHRPAAALDADRPGQAGHGDGRVEQQPRAGPAFKSGAALECAVRAVGRPAAPAGRQRAARLVGCRHRLDALCALGDFASLHPDYAFAELDPAAEAVLQARGLGHPLIPQAQRVGNDFTLQDLGEVILITGSNMAGKSTWLRALGVNLCLAYAGGPAAATALRLRPLRLHTCLRISDSLVDGFSYFYAEVKCLKRLLEALNAEHPLPLFYLIDEIFRGTNNRERLIGSRAYVRALLNGRGAGLIATHDLELAHLAEQNPQLHNYHFRDQVEAGRLVFDYQLRPGPSPTTNALKIMELEGLPVESPP
jgi:hypothetical protein